MLARGVWVAAGPLYPNAFGQAQVHLSTPYTVQVQPPVAVGGATLQHRPVNQPEVACRTISLLPRDPVVPSEVDAVGQLGGPCFPPG